MADKRHNLDTIANALIGKLSEMEKLTKRIEQVASTKLEVDTDELEVVLGEERRKTKAVLDSHLDSLEKLQKRQEDFERESLKHIEKLRAKNKTRVPNYIVWGIVFLVFVLGVLIFKAWMLQN